MLAQPTSIHAVSHPSTVGERLQANHIAKPKLRLASKSAEDLKEARDLLVAAEACIKLLGGLVEPGVRMRHQRIITQIHFEITQVDAELAGQTTRSDSDDDE